MRIRIGNLTMTNHPIHLHGHDFEVTGTDGGWMPQAARWPEVTADVAVGQMRAIEFVADEPGDWAFHCHKSHHTMNAMGHDVPTMIGVDHRGVAEKISELMPDYMAMGERGMADMGEMEMPLPDNTLPMMTGQGPFGPLEMGGMFTRRQGPRRTGARRLHGSGLVPASAGHAGLRVDRRRCPRRTAPGSGPVPPAGKDASNVRKGVTHHGRIEFKDAPAGRPWRSRPDRLAHGDKPDAKSPRSRPRRPSSSPSASPATRGRSRAP